jgi:hypothetical protein
MQYPKISFTSISTEYPLIFLPTLNLQGILSKALKILELKIIGFIFNKRLVLFY